ncbi:hypothetical protein AVEN_19466-1 [Araneus ventricosus]|uniref:Uncharacterized protein n=1 Tax=Araneus ventricosus TaxID=182803 RepID=A0A4Y2C812_ARAVE|nr:hypothetical protein AVEN_19466-1 [Araneus ventricosus]
MMVIQKHSTTCKFIHYQLSLIPSVNQAPQPKYLLPPHFHIYGPIMQRRGVMEIQLSWTTNLPLHATPILTGFHTDDRSVLAWNCRSRMASVTSSLSRPEAKFLRPTLRRGQKKKLWRREGIVRRSSMTRAERGG